MTPDDDNRDVSNKERAFLTVSLFGSSSGSTSRLLGAWLLSESSPFCVDSCSTGTTIAGLAVTGATGSLKMGDPGGLVGNWTTDEHFSQRTLIVDGVGLDGAG
jgi:hypothetical protein